MKFLVSGQVILLAVCTVMVAINAFDLFSSFYLIAQEFGEDLSLLGLIGAAMTGGIGILLVPGGLISTKYGPKMAALIGALMIGGATFLTSISEDIFGLVISRFIVGGGMALFLPSALILASIQIRKDSPALGMGIISGANAAGGIIGLAIWLLVIQALGWRYGIALGGVTAVIAALLIHFGIPRATMQPFRLQKSQLRRVFSDKTLIIIGLMLLGSQAVFEQTLGFMPFYLQSALQIDPATAGLIGGITLVASLAGAPITGWLFDKTRDFYKLIVALGVLILFGAAINFILTSAGALLSVISVGFAGAGLFTLFSYAARYRSLQAAANRDPEYSPLSINWIHTIALTGTLWAPLLFSSISLSYGYRWAWPTIGAISFALILISLLIGRRLKLVSISREIASE